jgi:hypothetical protein
MRTVVGVAQAAVGDTASYLESGRQPLSPLALRDRRTPGAEIWGRRIEVANPSAVCQPVPYGAALSGLARSHFLAECLADDVELVTFTKAADHGVA